MTRLLAAVLALLLSAPLAHADCYSERRGAGSGHYALKEGLAYDEQTGLTWARCEIGQTWQGTACAGESRLLTFEAAWAEAKEDASATAGLRRSGDALMVRGSAAQKVEGDAKLSIDLKGFSRGTAFSTETSGMFKNVHLDRGRQMAESE